jgi:phosphoribosyl-AMP cyclohydrolase
MNAWLDEVVFDSQGLVPVIAQDHQTGEVLMVAWANAQALQETAESQRAVYWSRSRKKLWRKGEESGHVQLVRGIRLDCDGDVVLLKVEQVGGIACHTGRRGCFFRALQDGSGGLAWETVEPVLKDPKQIYPGSGA